MSNVFSRAWQRLTAGSGWREVHSTLPHPVFGELQFTGRRTRPDGPVYGIWKVTYPPAGITHPVSIELPSGAWPDKMPPEDELMQVKALLDDLDGIFERCRPEVAALYERVVEAPMPADWRAAFRLDSLRLPDEEEADSTLDVAYWCEAALHWFVVQFEGTKVLGVEMEG